MGGQAGIEKGQKGRASFFFSRHMQPRSNILAPAEGVGGISRLVEAWHESE